MILPLGQIASPEDDRFLKMWQVQVDQANRILREHRHINFEIAVVLDGKGVYHTASGVCDMEPGDVFVFSGSEPHCITKILPGGLQLINLHFNWQFFSRCCMAADRYPNMFFAHSKGFVNRIEASCAEPLRQLLDRIRRELEAEEPQWESAVGACVNMLFAELLRHHGYYTPEEGAHRAMDKILLGVRFIDEHFTEDITLEQIAEKSGITPNYFTKLFRDCFQVRLWDYITAKRIDRAKRLLSSGSAMTVLQIAEECGFHNTANFNRAFLKFTGISPSTYKSRRELLH